MSRLNRWLDWQPRTPNLFKKPPEGTDKTDKTGSVGFVSAVPALSQKIKEARPVAPELVTLTGGLAVRVAALELLVSLEARGCAVRLEPDGTLLVGPRERVTVADATQIRVHQDDLLALVHYCERLQ